MYREINSPLIPIQKGSGIMNEKTSGKMSVRKKILIVIILLVLMLICFLLGMFTQSLKKPSGGGMRFEAGVGISSNIETPAQQQGIAVKGMAQMFIPAGEKTVAASFENPKENTGLYYLTFELKADIGGKSETLYTSGLVKAGEQVSSITLSQPLEKGKYSAVLHIQPYSISLAPTNNADIPLTLIVS